MSEANLRDVIPPGGDKQMAMLPNFNEIIEENNIKYIIAILPRTSIYDEILGHINLPHTVMTYNGHTPDLDEELFKKQCEMIESYRKERGNIFIFCNNGYQRSLPFLCWYLTKFHKDEVPSIDKAIDIILPQVDKDNYGTVRDRLIRNIKSLFK